MLHRLDGELHLNFLKILSIFRVKAWDGHGERVFDVSSVMRRMNLCMIAWDDDELDIIRMSFYSSRTFIEA